MKVNKLKLVLHLCILIFIIASFAIIFHKWETNPKAVPTIHKETKIADNGKYLKERDKDIKEPKKLKTIFNKKDVKYKEIDEYLKNSLFNGTVAVYENGKLKMNKGYGYQDFENNIKNTPSTMYLIGSAQKFSTGLMLKQLEEEHKININDSVTKYIPWFKTSKKITLKDLMLHRSGLYKYKASKDYKNLDQAVSAIQQKGINDKKYHKHQYNDGNYLVLAKVIEVVTKQTYAENYYNRLADPLNLNHSAFYDEKPFKKYMAKGYKYNNTHLSFLKPNILDQYYGAGNLYMTTADMGKLILGLQHDKVVNPSITNALTHEYGTKQYPEQYRYGFYVGPFNDRVNGVFFGQTFTAYFNDKYIVVLSTNIKSQNEIKIKHIFRNILQQTELYNQQGVIVK
ncbi:serine hydrolase domain-containing protein [Staphylococcus simiae]|uniref:Autolysis and methicillin resistant-related protein n=1 Tax=Staphylococcus simiae CCM 7213 = CCUG 51256 TaxID=911238 RepID=G5JHC5_9STAP|nr:serine hydrolase domain-containing protein [Staphylococcus simiae]EHJ08473.1 autolysis and methicillin resistant-related protein [Staphylococcus simiae CCM 7213 = CCUG 51256]PNZ11753.1 methicillin resistance protein FmtA [Staphylococcus simiae]SNV67787.1 FmtA protein involved in methicillin resistance; affects cell wall cross-linking and amidation [Staphylococcus simiae]